MGLKKNEKVLILWIPLTVFLIGLKLVASGTSPIDKRSLHSFNGDSENDRKWNTKRTFCNAFTGCGGSSGRKRSEGSSGSENKSNLNNYNQGEDYNSESIEDKFEEVAKNILAESRLYEAAMEAKQRMPKNERRYRNKRSEEEENSNPNKSRDFDEKNEGKSGNGEENKRE